MSANRTSERFQILSLDGGGIKGLFSAAVIAALEEDFDTPIVEHFDLITGTSTGGIVALCLGMGLSGRQNPVSRTFEIRDPVHGFVSLDAREWEVINQPAFQRFRRIKQLAWTDYIYPGATHNARYSNDLEAYDELSTAVRTFG